jgi:ubiquinone/menaquinone biosynthesis C-methylase UbiE
MDWSSLWPLGFALLLIGLLIYWELYICEGAHLGPRFVVWLYNLTARRYDRIKGFDPPWERRFLGEPVAAAAGHPGARILDVGAGTARLARALERVPMFRAQIINLEPSWRMIEHGRAACRLENCLWVQGLAVPLPFEARSFDLVVGLEMLEFTPHPEDTLREMARVLRPGGWLLITHRVGRDAPFILGRYIPRARFPAFLARAGFQAVEVFPWQVEYDLAWAQKPPGP